TSSGKKSTSMAFPPFQNISNWPHPGRLIKTDEWSRRIMRARINLEHILHGRDKRGVGGGWDHPIFLQMRLDIVFFKARPTVLKCAAATISRSTTVSASRRSVQRA